MDCAFTVENGWKFPCDRYKLLELRKRRKNLQYAF